MVLLSCRQACTGSVCGSAKDDVLIIGWGRSTINTHLGSTD
jgi:hypothetical protein